MSKSRIPNRTWAVLTFVAWTLYGLLFGIQAYVSNTLFGGHPITIWIPVGVWLSCAYAWALLTPGVIRLTQRYPMEPNQYLKSIPIHLLAALLFSSVQLMIYVLAQKYILGMSSVPPDDLGGL